MDESTLEQELERMVLTPMYIQKGVKPEEMEAIYAIGYHYYQVGSYEKAATVFKGLCLLDAMNAKYHMALGGAYQARKMWKQAADQYALVVAGIDIKNVTASQRAAECFDALGDTANADSARYHAQLFSKKEAAK